MLNDSTTQPALHINQLSETFSVSGEMHETDLKTLTDMGVDTIINVRPDFEVEHQISSERWQQLARAHNLHYALIAVKPCQYHREKVSSFKAALAQSNAKVHCFCRTGARAAHLWALANKDTLSFKQLHEVLSKNGYDLDVIAPMFTSEN